MPRSPGVEAELSTSGRTEPDLGPLVTTRSVRTPRITQGQREAYALLDPTYPTTLVRGRAGRVALAMGGRVIMVGRPSPSPTLYDDIPAEPRQISPLGGGRPSPSPAAINLQLSLEVLESVTGAGVRLM